MIESELWQLFHDKSGQYEVRTRHLDVNNSPLFINGLIKESSPYLLQHAHNPVNWVAWNEGAFEQARVENKPIFLSIGYATCHWCHVMEHESFEDLTVAEFLNQYFICIKVDREQHPVVDDFYMTALQLIAGQGGWPMSSFLTPNAEPFMAGTYFPQARFLDLLHQINDLWHEQQAQLLAQGQKVKQTVNRYLSATAPEAGVNLPPVYLAQANEKLCAELLAMVDKQNGGFGGAPKFPQEAWLQFLMYQYVDTQNSEVAESLVLSLTKMQQGGIHDHLAGGFHRYCVDEDWLVPHFEKMLYNQAQLLQLYAQAAVVFGEPSFADTARLIVDFVSAEMHSKDDLFYSALDADSFDEKGRMVEGAYYVWSWAELKALLSEPELDWLSAHYAVFPDGNFEGKNVLFQRDLQVVENLFPGIQAKLKPARALKARPLTDDKVIVSWNAMMIESLARAAVLLNDKAMLSLAEKAYASLKKTHWQGNQLWRVSQSGHQTGKRQDIPAVLSDYANLLCAALALYDVAKDSRYSSDALELLDLIKTKFWSDGSLYQSEITTSEVWQPKVVNAKDGATVSATAKLLQVLASVEALWSAYSGWIGTWFDDIISSQAQSMTKQNTAHSGLLTAALLRKNHVLGQNIIDKSGIKFNLMKTNDAVCEKGNEMAWQLGYQNQAPWHINHISIEQGGIKIDGSKPGEPHVYTDSAVLELTGFKAGHCRISWQLCDDTQCLPEQQLQLFLI